MEGLNNKVLQNFGISGRCTGRLKGGYLIKSSDGFYFVKKLNCSPEDIIFQDRIKKYLFNTGFRNIDIYYETLSGMPYFNFNSELYVMTDYVQGEELDFEDSRMYLKLIEQTAFMHQLMEQSGINAPQENNCLKEYKRLLALLKSYKKLVSKLKKLSDFDIMFLKNYEYYYGMAQNAIYLMEKNNYEQIFKNGGELIHNLLKRENLYALNDEIYIVNFSAAKKGLGVNDLSDLIYRFIKYNKNPHIGINEIIHTYTAVKPLNTAEINITYAMLQFPMDFCKICGQYYMKKRSWIPGAIISKGSEIIEQKEKYEKFINQLTIF